MNTRWMRRAGAFAFVLLLVSCTAGGPAEMPAAAPIATPAATPSAVAAPTATPEANVTQPTPSAAASEGEMSIATASNGFGFNVLQELHNSAQDDNIFISPLSLSLLLQMIYNGADGQVAQEMAQVLQVQGMELPAMNEASKALQDDLGATSDVELDLANSIWVDQGFQLLDSFLNTVTTYFDATAETLDFSNPAATERVNQWVSDATQGKIDKLFDALDPGIVTYLIDAVYFKGQWTLPFDPAQTQPMPFHLADGSEISVPAMMQAGEYAMTSAAEYSAIALPYGDGRMQMVIVLPNAGVELNSVLSELTPEAWQTLVGQLQNKTGVMLSLPRFKVEYEQVLNDALIKLGMPSAFAQTDFANMTDGGGLMISYVLQKAVVEVSEEGTAAAAVSVGAMTKGVLATQPFTVDRPFFFAIYDSTTGAILFMGTVYQPQPLDE